MIIFLFFSINSFALDNVSDLNYLLDLIKKNPSAPLPKEQIYTKNNLLYCTGKNNLAIINNRVANLIEQYKYKDAIIFLKKGMKKAPLFFPFQYNLGVAYLKDNRLRYSLLHFKKASYLVPEYSRTYLNMGYLYELQHKPSSAIEYYRLAIKKNHKELEGYISIGNIYFKRNQLLLAKKYYKFTLKIDYKYPNGLLGLAKILFKQKKYYKAIVILKTINTKIFYNKELHYFYAECAYKLRQYKTAAFHYKKLLQFKNDKFFLENSPALIRHKLNLSKQFIQ